jgi:hypothetical protein
MVFFYKKIPDVGFEALRKEVMSVAIFRDIATCSPYVNRRFEGFRFSTLKMEAIWYSSTSIKIRTIGCYIPEDGDIQKNRHSLYFWSTVRRNCDCYKPVATTAHIN